MKTLIAVIILIFSFQSLSKADDIRDFQIEGMSIGDSLLDYMSKEEIKIEIEESKKLYPNKSKNFSEIYWYNETDNYNYLSFIIKNDESKSNKKYIIYAIYGKKHMVLKECLELKKNIAEEFEIMFPNTERRNSEFSPDFSTDLDPFKKSKIYYSYFEFDTKDEIAVECYDYSKYLEDKGRKDGLNISLASKNANLWLREKN